MVNCNRRQREIYKGTKQFRCVNPDSKNFGSVIPDAICAACPFVIHKTKTCKEIRKTRKQEEHKLPVLNLQPGYPECPYRYTCTDAKTLKCSITNLRVDPGICARCDKETRKRTAKLGTKIVNYFGAIRRWVASGRPRRTQEEIESLFETHCKRCKRYDQNNHACQNCGCQVSTDSEPLDNKLAMATEHCPLGRF